MLFVTDLITFMHCPRRLYAIKKLGYREPSTREMVFGNVVHDVAEQVSGHDARIVRSLALVQSREEVVDAYRQFAHKVLSRAIVDRREDLMKAGAVLMECYRWARPAVELFAQRRAAVVHERFAVHGSGALKLLVSEVRTEVPVESAPLGLRGRIDELRFTADGVVPVEIKTGSMPKEGAWKHHQVQLAAYGLMLEEQGRVAREAKVHYVIHGEERHVFLNPFLKDEVRKIVGECVALLARAVIPEVGCGACGACTVFRSRLAHAPVSAGKSF